MNYNTEFQNNNGELQEILKAVNELPDAGIGVTDVVRYGEQTLTEEQKAQARENIGIVGTGKDGEDGFSVWYDSAITVSPEGIYECQIFDGENLAKKLKDLVIDEHGDVYRCASVVSAGIMALEYLCSIKGEKGDKGDKGDTYTLTSTDKNSIAAAVKSSLPTLSMVGTDENGVEHTWTIYGS